MFKNALCTGLPTEWWFPIRKGKTRTELSEISRNMQKAMAICRTCPAIVDCAKHSLRNDEIGIWGGMGEKTRKKARQMIRVGITVEKVVNQLVLAKSS